MVESKIPLYVLDADTGKRVRLATKDKSGSNELIVAIDKQAPEVIAIPNGVYTAPQTSEPQVAPTGEVYIIFTVIQGVKLSLCVDIYNVAENNYVEVFRSSQVSKPKTITYKVQVSKHWRVRTTDGGIYSVGIAYI